MLPKYKILTYTGAVLDYTITDDVETLHVKDQLNGVGSFSFSLPTTRGLGSSGYQYNDIALNDTAHIYIGYTAVPASANFVGKITRITGPLTTEKGFYRIIEGRLQSEVLDRRIKPFTAWAATHAHDIIIDLANDLSLGVGDIDNTDASSLTVYTADEIYMDLLKRISDYWVSAGTQIKNDFYVDTAGNLVWHPRPIRTAGTETLSVGQNVLAYSVNKDVESVKNDITVYGVQGKVGEPYSLGNKEPVNGDSWTEDDPIANWTETYGTRSYENVDGPPQVGSFCLEVISEDVAGIDKTLISRSVDITNFGYNAYQTINFYSGTTSLGGTYQVCLYAPDSSNYFYCSYTPAISPPGLGWISRELGENWEYDSVKMPTGYWYKTGSPHWGNIRGLALQTYKAHPFDHTMYYDGMYFGHGRFRYHIIALGTGHDADAEASANAYGQRDLQVVDDSLLSNTDCEIRARTLLYQLKDPPTRVDIETIGNMNILIGDRLTLTIPAEGISAQSYDVVSVVHDLTKDSFTTQASLLNSANVRQLPATTPFESIIKKGEAQRLLAKGRYEIK